MEYSCVPSVLTTLYLPLPPQAHSPKTMMTASVRQIILFFIKVYRLSMK